MVVAHDVEDFSKIWQAMLQELYQSTSQLGMHCGSDTMTKLIELCQEKVGVRSENNIACARLLLYFGVTVH